MFDQQTARWRRLVVWAMLFWFLRSEQSAIEASKRVLEWMESDD